MFHCVQAENIYLQKDRLFFKENYTSYREIKVLFIGVWINRWSWISTDLEVIVFEFQGVNEWSVDHELIRSLGIESDSSSQAICFLGKETFFAGWSRPSWLGFSAKWLGFFVSSWFSARFSGSFLLSFHFLLVLSENVISGRDELEMHSLEHGSQMRSWRRGDIPQFGVSHLHQSCRSISLKKKYKLKFIHSEKCPFWKSHKSIPWPVSLCFSDSLSLSQRCWGKRPNYEIKVLRSWDRSCANLRFTTLT